MDGERRLHIHTDPAALARAAAARFAELAQDARSEQRGFHVALAGGSTPRLLYQTLAADYRERVDWAATHVYFGDERCVPPDHPDSNYRMAREAMLDKVPVPPENVFPVPVDGSPEEAAMRYERTLQEAYGGTELEPTRPLLDINLLGLGPDGHTASLIPGEPVLEERKRWVAAVPHGRPEVRITMTYPVLESCRHAAFIVSGERKAAIVAAILAGGSQVPAARIKPVGQLIWFLDRAAAGQTT